MNRMTFALCALALAACGGGGNDEQASGTPSPENGQPYDAALGARTASVPGAPYFLDANNRASYIGALSGQIDVTDLVCGVGTGADARICTGRANDGVGRNAVLEFMSEGIADRGFVIKWDEPPVVRIVAGASAELIEVTEYTVASINAYLPADWQLDLDPEPVPANESDAIDGEILIEFAPSSQWPDAADDPDGFHLGQAVVEYFGNGDIANTRIWFDEDANTENLSLYASLAHEILHALGLGHPADLSRTDTVMSYGARDETNLLHPLDQEALHALYSRLNGGTTAALLAADLGPWASDSTYVIGADRFGAGGHVLYRVRNHNGQLVPWVSGTAPMTDAADNRSLPTLATWNGNLVGFTPTAQQVSGGAEIVIDFSDMDGTADFTSLEQWGPDVRALEPGTGTMWGDGNLHYSLQVRGNQFGNYEEEPGDDYGVLDGGFFGSSHEGAAGVLSRDDLTAAFGGSRD